MPIDKAVNQAPVLDVVIGSPGPQMDIEVVIDDDGGATVEIGEDAGNEVDFYANLAEVIEPEELSRVAIEVSALFEADKSSRSDWEQMYAKGLDLLGLKLEERTKPFRGASGVTHPMPSGLGHITATCCITWTPACSASSTWRRGRSWQE